MVRMDSSHPQPAERHELAVLLTGTELVLDASSIVAVHLPLVEQLAAAAQVEFDPAFAEQMFARVARSATPVLSWSLWQAWTRELGMVLAIDSAEWNEVFSAAAPHAPVLLAHGTTERPAWCLIYGKRRGRIGVQRANEAAPTWLKIQDAMSALALPTGDASPPAGDTPRLTYGRVQASAPAESLRAVADAHHLDEEADGHGDVPLHGDSNAAWPAHPHHPPHHPTPWRRLLSWLRPERRDIGMLVVFALVSGLLMLAIPIAVEALVNFVAFGAVVQPVVVLAIVLGVFLGFGAVMRGMQTFLVELLERRILLRLATDLAVRLPRIHRQSFDQGRPEEMVNRFFDVTTVQKSLASLLLDGLALVLQIAISLAVLAFYHPVLLGFDILLVTCASAILFLLGRGAVRSAIMESRAKYALAGWLEEIARNPIAFKHPAAAKLGWDRSESLSRRYLEERQAHFQILFRQISAGLCLHVAASVAVLAIGGWLVVRGEMTLGQLVAAELLVSAVVGGFAKIGKYLGTTYDLLAAIDKLGHLVDMPLESERGEFATATGPAQLTAHDVTWRSTDGGAALGPWSFDIQPGECIAICGASGSGKTILGEMLFGLFNPTTGTIECDGVDLRDWRLDSYRRQVTVLADLEFFEGTILDNIRFGRSELDLMTIDRVIRECGLEPAVRRLPSSLHSRLSHRGAPLTEEQRVRLALARAIVDRPRLLVVDGLFDRCSPSTKAELVRVLRQRSSHTTVCLLTRDPQLAALATRSIGWDGVPSGLTGALARPPRRSCNSELS